jgi:hypothetical protein
VGVAPPPADRHPIARLDCASRLPHGRHDTGHV